jgi:hypothetical protein
MEVKSWHQYNSYKNTLNDWTMNDFLTNTIFITHILLRI